MLIEFHVAKGLVPIKQVHSEKYSRSKHHLNGQAATSYPVLVQGLSRLAFLKNTYQVIRRARHMAENMHEHLWLISPYYQSSCQMVLRNSPSTSFTSQIIRGTLLNLTFSTIISCLDNVVDHILKFSLTHCLLVLRNLRKQKK